MKTLTHMTLAAALMLSIALPAWAQPRQSRQGGNARQAVQNRSADQQQTCDQDCPQQNTGTCDQQGLGQRMGGRGMGRGGMGRGRGRQMGRRGQGQGNGLRRAGLCQSEEIVPLTSDETKSVLAMREEEKLARDVYLTLNNQFPSLVFVRIATSEQRHTDAIARIIATQGLVDPVVDDAIGKFTDPTFTDLYAGLVADGSADYIAALKVGAYIEEIDIADLKEALDAVTNPQVKRVFENLLNASYNHLRAFVANFEADGQPYEPQVLDAETYTEIVNGDSLKGRGWRTQQGQCKDPQAQCTTPQTQPKGTPRRGR